MTERKHNVRALLLGAATVSIMAGSLMAGTAHAEAAGDAAKAENGEPLVITGSRLVTNGNKAPTPVTVITLDSMKNVTPTTVFDQLSEAPAFSMSSGPNTPNGYLPNSNTGVAALNLRGIGSQRVLVLFEGHRVPPSTPDGLVDVNLMPQLLMQHVDVVTGGASAIYGSDAISGVVNMVIDRKFNGLKVELQRGVSGHDDAKSYQAGFAYGTDLAGGRAHFEMSYQRISNDGLGPIAASRPGIFNWTLQGNGTSVPYHMVQGARSTFFTFGGLVSNPGGAFDNYTFNQNGVLTPFVNGSTDGLNSNTQVGGDGAYTTSSWLQSSQRLDQVFARLDFDISDTTHFYINGGGSIDYAYGGFSPGIDGHLGFGACNAFLSTAQQAAFGCTNQADPNQPVFFLNKLPDALTNLLKTTQSGTTVKDFNILAGFEGKFGKGWRWDTSFSMAQTNQKVVAYGIDEDPHLYAAMDAVVAPNGQIVCNITLTNPGLQPGCVPLNLFGPTSETQAALNYTFGAITRTGINKMFGWDGTLRGSPINGWAGPVDVALSADLRSQSLEVSSSSVANGSDCTGQRFGNCDPVQTNTWGNTVQPLAPVHQTSGELAFEVSLPLIKGGKLLKSLVTDDAFRYTKYWNSGEGYKTTINTTSWKLGLVGELGDSVTLRVSRSRDMRAPNLWDLFNPIATQPFSNGTLDYLIDPVNGYNTGLGAPVTSGGNPYLKPEVGNTLTLGLIYHPSENFSLSLDAYDIKVTNAITVLSGLDQVTQEACYASGGTSPACSLQVRKLGNFTNTTTANPVIMWYQRGVNIAGVHTQGIDIESNYKTTINHQPFSVRALLSYKPHLIYSEPGFKTIDQAGAAYYQGFGGLFPAPKWRAEVVLNYNPTKTIGINLSERWRSQMRFQGDSSLTEVGHVASVAYTNVNISYAFPQMPKTSVFLNVQNVFDQSPPVAGQANQGLPGGSPNGWALGDDVIGRYFTFGVRARF